MSHKERGSDLARRDGGPQARVYSAGRGPRDETMKDQEQDRNGKEIEVGKGSRKRKKKYKEGVV